MRMDDFFTKHGLKANPFCQEDAKDDLVFQRGCIDHTYHPLWGRIYGDPEAPSAAVVLGERGSGKTALRFQIVDHLKKHNQKNPDQKVLVIEYHDFNRFIDEFCRQGASLDKWELQDHMDCILSLGVTKLLDAAIGNKIDDKIASRLKDLDWHERRDLLMLALAYDHTDRTSRMNRCKLIGKTIHYPSLLHKAFARTGVWLTFLIRALIVLGAIWLSLQYPSLQEWWLLVVPAIFIFGTYVPYLKSRHWASSLAKKINQSIRVIPHDETELRQIILKLPRRDLDHQPITKLNDHDARYGLLKKLMRVGLKLGFTGIIVIADRIDEPSHINGNVDKMFQFTRPILESKFLGHEGMGIKLLLPADLHRSIQKQLDENVARLDKQHYVRSLEWTGTSLYDLINARLRACAVSSESVPILRQLLDETITNEELIVFLGKLRIPRHAFKFMDRMLAKHCQSHTDEMAIWKISRDTFVESKAEFSRQLEDYDRGLHT